MAHLDAEQIKTIVDKVVPLIAEESDYPFFRGVITLRLEEARNSAEAALFVKSLLSANTTAVAH